MGRNLRPIDWTYNYTLPPAGHQYCHPYGIGVSTHNLLSGYIPAVFTALHKAGFGKGPIGVYTILMKT